MTELFQLDIKALRRRFLDGTLDPVALLDHYQSRIDQLNPMLNALIAPDPTARHQAEASAKRYRSEKPLGPLDGISVTVKDNILQTGLAATIGSPVFESHHPKKDETAVACLRRAGAVLLGKTNVPEFCLEGFCSNTLFGTSKKPLEPGAYAGRL